MRPVLDIVIIILETACCGAVVFFCAYALART